MRPLWETWGLLTLGVLWLIAGDLASANIYFAAILVLVGVWKINRKSK